MRADFNATKQTRFKRIQKGLPASGSGADYHYRNERQYLQLIEMVRDFERNDPTIRSAFNRLTSNVIRNGFTPDATTTDPEVNKRLIGKWQPWAENRDECDISGERSFVDMEKLAFRSMTRDGDISAVLLDSGQIKWYEAHRLRTPRNTKRNVIHGVLMDEHRKREQFWFTKDDIDTWQTLEKVSEITPIEARDEFGNRQVLQLYYPDRFSQTRGITVCAPCVDTIGMQDDIQFAKMVQQKVVSCYTIFRKRGEAWKPDAAGGDGAATVNDYSLGMKRVLEELYPGMIVDCDKDEELSGFSPNVPNPEFFQHAMMLLGFIAAALDLPLMVLLLDPTRTNFSGWRGAIDQARLRFEDIQRWFSGIFHREVWRWKVRQWLRTEDWLQKAVANGVDVFAHQWNPPGWDYIEPLKDIQADAEKIRTGQSSSRRVLALHGLKHDIISKETSEDWGVSLQNAADAADAFNIANESRITKWGWQPADYRWCPGVMPDMSKMTLTDTSMATQDANASDQNAAPSQSLVDTELEEVSA